MKFWDVVFVWLAVFTAILNIQTAARKPRGWDQVIWYGIAALWITSVIKYLITKY